MPSTAFVSMPRACATTPSVPDITRKPTVAARAETPSFRAMPSATPIAKIRPSAAKIGSPDPWRIWRNTKIGSATMPAAMGSPTAPSTAHAAASAAMATPSTVQKPCVRASWR